MFEYIIVVYYDADNVTRRIYGLIYGPTEAEALANLGNYYDDGICRIEYFGFAGDPDFPLYELNDDYADNYKVSGRKFRKIIPTLNEIPKGEIVE
jgi:hypothetical protein